VAGDGFVEAWGMTETAGTAITATTRDDALGHTEAQQVHATSGRAVADAVVRIVDEDGSPVPQDGATIGEATLRSAAVMAGYWGRPRKTEEAFRDGWYHTGDLAYMDAAGYVYITDRRDDLIVSGGLNVYPSEVEAAINELEGVRECAIVGVPHERWGQTPVAAVVLESNADLSPERIIQHCRERLAGYKKPTRVEFLEGLPRTASNKVLRHVLRDRLGHGDHDGDG
jgi:fatty-acyl-CoA synthase